MNGAEDLTQEQRVLHQGALVASMRTAAGSPLAQGPDALPNQDQNPEECILPLKDEVTQTHKHNKHTHTHTHSLSLGLLLLLGTTHT